MTQLEKVEVQGRRRRNFPLSHNYFDDVSTFKDLLGLKTT